MRILIFTISIFALGAATALAGDVPPSPKEQPPSVTITLTAEQVAALPQILDVAIKQMGLSAGTVMAIQIAQSVTIAQQHAANPDHQK
jgi:hypothetical protein